MATTDTILAKLDAKTLTSIVIDRKYLDQYDTQTLPEKYSKRVYDRETCLNLISKDLKRQSIIQFVQILHVDELKEWTKAIEKSVLTSKKINNPNNSVVMKKRLKEQLEHDGLRKYIKNAEPSRKLLRATLDSLAVETKSDNRTELVSMLFKQLKLNALEYILLELSNKTLQQMIVDSQLNIKLTTAKPTLVRHLVEMKDYVPKKMPIREKKPANMKTQKKPKTKNGQEEKENLVPNMRTGLQNIELVFESDDSEEFNPKKVVEMELSIDSKDDAEKYPPPLYESLSETGDSTESDRDYNGREKRKRKRRHHKKSKKSKSRRRHSKKYFTSSSDDEGSQRKSRRKRESRKDKPKKYRSDEEKDETENPKPNEVTDDKDKQQKNDSAEKDLKLKNIPGEAETVEKDPKSKDPAEKDPKSKKPHIHEETKEKDKSDSDEEEKPPKSKKKADEDPKSKKKADEDPKPKKTRDHKKDIPEDTKEKDKSDSNEEEEDKVIDKKITKKRTSDEFEDKDKKHKKQHTDDLEKKHRKHKDVVDSEEPEEKIPKKGKESDPKKPASNPEEIKPKPSEVSSDIKRSIKQKDEKKRN